MSTASGDTEPDHLGYGYNPDGHEGDFARLTPLSSWAQASFDIVADRMERDLTWALNARRFIRYDQSLAAPQSLNYCGYYRFNMDIPPRQPDLQCVAGRDPVTADFLLADPGNAFSMIARAHFQFYYDPTATMLMLRCTAGRELIVDGKGVVTAGAARMLTAESGILIGALAYVYSRTDFPDKQYRSQLLDFRRSQGWKSVELPPYLGTTPQLQAHVFQDFIINSSVLGGTYGAVGFGWRLSTGHAVAAKRVVSKPNAVRAVQAEISLLKELNHVRIPSYHFIVITLKAFTA